jgi:hypothetical protein
MFAIALGSFRRRPSSIRRSRPAAGMSQGYRILGKESYRGIHVDQLKSVWHIRYASADAAKASSIVP